METQTLTFATTLLFAASTFAQPTPGIWPQIKQNAGICFTENKGQVHDQNYNTRPDVLYSALAGNLAVHIKSNGVSYQLYRIDKWKEAKDTKLDFRSKKADGLKEVAQQTIYRIDLSWVNCNSNFTNTVDETLSGYNNYYLESCPEGASHVKSYKGITLKNLYKGINLHYYEKKGELKHDYIVAPHTNYKQIQLKVEGAEIEINKDGSLILTTPLGRVQEGAPIVFQNGKQLSARWIVHADILSFEVNNYDPAYKLIIDPVTRVWGTYYGGSGDDRGMCVRTDSTGNVYLAGSTSSGTSSMITTSGAHQTSYAGGTDAFLVKFSGSGARLWSTYYGGNKLDVAYACATDYLGNVYLAGTTYSSSAAVMATAGCHQPVHGGDPGDAFLAKFDANGVRLWGTYYGGNSNDDALACATDAAGNVYIAGSTASNNGTTIASSGSHQSTIGGGYYDGYLAKFNSSGVRLWATYYGGAGDDFVAGCATDPSGNVFVVGSNQSQPSGTNLATPGSHQPVWGGNQDGFLAKFNGAGVRQWGTYYGGFTSEDANSCATDALGNVYITGTTDGSSSAIATSVSHQSSYGGGTHDGYLAKFNAGGVRQWGTYYGGPGSDGTSSVTLDKYGSVFIVGGSSGASGTTIATPGTYQPFPAGFDAFLAKFTSSGTRQWGTYYGTTTVVAGYSCATDTMKNIYMCGLVQVSTGTAVATSTGYQPLYGGGTYDGFLVKFNFCTAAPPQPVAINGPSVTCAGSITAFSTPTVLGVNSQTWTTPGSWTGTTSVNAISVTPFSSGVITLVNDNGCGVSPQQTLYLTVNPQPTVTLNSGAICTGQSFTLLAIGANTYTYSSGPVISPVTTSSYSVTGTSTAGCVSTNPAVSTITVNPLPTITFSTTKTTLCVGETATITASGASTLVFNPEGAVSEITVSPTVTQTYSVTGIDVNGCSNTSVFTQSVSACLGVYQLASSSRQWVVYPNPSKGIVHLELDSDTEIIIVNAIGQIVFSSKFSSGNHQINIEHLAKGIYVLKPVGTANSTVYKMILE